MIHFTNVSKTYPNGFQALNKINFHINAGEMAFIAGHSGAGKSTLLKLIVNIEKSTGGEVVINGDAISNFSHRQTANLRRNVGVIFQNPQLLPDLSILENVALPLTLSGYRPKEKKRRAQTALDLVDLGSKQKMLPYALSAGEQQRVGIARAVVNSPKIILADEPTGNLDPELSKEIIDVFAAFNELGKTILIVTHDLPLIASLNFRIITLRAGKIIGGIYA